MPDGAQVSVSVVSHGQGALVEHLLAQLAACPDVGQVLLTRNIPEGEIRVPDALASRVSWIDNAEPKGFGANHNTAAALATGRFLCVLNPDIRLSADPFAPLVKALEESASRVALVAPGVTDPAGHIEDSVRRFPTVWGLFKKLIRVSDGRILLGPTSAMTEVDWVAGMFMLIRTDEFLQAGGFDDAFFLYYEDVDLCERLHARGREVAVCPSVLVVHDARRQSHRSARYLKWHLGSMLRYFLKHPRRIFSVNT